MVKSWFSKEDELNYVWLLKIVYLEAKMLNSQLYLHPHPFFIMEPFILWLIYKYALKIILLHDATPEIFSTSLISAHGKWAFEALINPSQ